MRSHVWKQWNGWRSPPHATDSNEDERRARPDVEHPRDVRLGLRRPRACAARRRPRCPPAPRAGRRASRPARAARARRPPGGRAGSRTRAAPPGRPRSAAARGSSRGCFSGRPSASAAQRGSWATSARSTVSETANPSRSTSSWKKPSDDWRSHERSRESAMNVPRPLMRSIRPSDSSRWSASRTVGRETRNREPISGSEASRSPGARCPFTISSVRSRASWK